MHKSAQQPLVAFDFMLGVLGHARQTIKVVCTTIGQWVHLHPGPSIFQRIQLRSVGRKIFDVQSRALGDEPRHGCGTVHGKTIPHEYDGASQMPQQLPQEVDRLRSFDRLAVQLPGKAQLMAARADRDRSHRREMFVRTEPVPQHRRDAGDRPGATQQRIQQNAGFVAENEVRREPCRLFLMRGQSLRTQFSISSSSRSTARRVDFCGVKPKLRNNRGR